MKRLPRTLRTRTDWKIQAELAAEEKTRWEKALKTGKFSRIQNLEWIFIDRAKSWVKYHRREHDEDYILWLRNLTRVLLMVIDDMNARMRLGYLPYNRKKESRNIIYTYFELYDYSQTDNEITRGDEETKRYLQIGAWKYITPPEARKKPEKQDEKEEEKDVKEEKGVKDVRDEKDVKSEKDVKKDEKDVSDEKDVKPTGTIWTTRLRARQ